MEFNMPTEVWEYTPSGRSWEQRFAYDAAVPVPPAKPTLPVRAVDVVVLGLLAAVLMWFAHQFRTGRVAAVSAPVVAQAPAGAAAPAGKEVSFENCKLLKPGLQREQLDGIPEHVQLRPYVFTSCNGVQVTLWSEMR